MTLFSTHIELYPDAPSLFPFLFLSFVISIRLRVLEAFITWNYFPSH